ncbi:ATP-binding protein [Desulfallas thermosapovorans]|uniref:histidine kinase n=1 Tax=Desulfallas thermosapovorans DSM 6562 TaxID=1121431 RepID=A0A5S4ZVC1_9FIRM|nr:ATP-binding protein [Desulfallas thermosapovorans]TYO96872.1 PAS domain S-box-containing protein [Desulfallas thermosapovorans DSM 6562]
MKPKVILGQNIDLKKILQLELLSETEKRQFYEELVGEFEQINTIIDSLKAVIYVADIDSYQILFINKFGTDIFGTDSVGKRCFEVFQNRQSGPCPYCTNSHLVKNGVVQPPYVWEHYNDITKTWVKCIDTAIRWSDGRLVRMEIAINITEQKLAEETLKQSQEQLEKLIAERTVKLIKSNEHLKREIKKRKEIEESLRESEERYRQLVEHSQNMIAIYIDEKLAFINKTGVDLLGAQEASEIIGKSIWDFVHPNSQESVKEKIRYLHSNPRSVIPASREKIIRFDGAVVDLEITVYSLTYQGKPAIKIVARDITEQRWFKKEMTRLERLNVIGQMAAGIGHEIRNPMTTVRGFLQLLAQKKECAQYIEYFNLMISELDRVNLLITEFLSLAKDKPSKLEMQSLNPIVKTILPLILADAVNEDKNVVHELKDTPDILIDEKEIRQLIYNLCRNGLQAMPAGGTLTIKTYVDVDEVVLAIKDEGNGIDPEVLDKLGTPFFTTKNDGTGLGLSICYSIAARHNASISLETSPAGTTFFVRFKI